jgi:hypothetical protein
MVVVDASDTKARCLEDGATIAMDAVLDRLGGAHAVVPAIWRLELADVLLERPVAA